MRFVLALFALVCVLALAALSPPLALAVFFVGVLVSQYRPGLFAVNAALPPTYNNDSPAGGSVVFGCQTTTVPTAPGNASPQAYETEELSLEFDSDWTVQKNSAARPNKQMGIPTIPLANLTLQLVAGTQAPPYPLGAEFTLQTLNSVTYTFITAGVVHALKNDGTASKVTVKVRYKIN